MKDVEKAVGVINQATRAQPPERFADGCAANSHKGGQEMVGQDKSLPAGSILALEKPACAAGLHGVHLIACGSADGLAEQREQVAVYKIRQRWTMAGHSQKGGRAQLERRPGNLNHRSPQGLVGAQQDRHTGNALVADDRDFHGRASGKRNQD
jgi:hypothetical protein